MTSGAAGGWAWVGKIKKERLEFGYGLSELHLLSSSPFQFLKIPSLHLIIRFFSKQEPTVAILERRESLKIYTPNVEWEAKGGNGNAGAS